MIHIGKLPNPILHRHIISQLEQKRKEVIMGPQIGIDCGIIDLADDLCVISTDPITAASHNAGYIGVHIACNDLAAAGAECVGITLTILAAPGSHIGELETIVEDVNTATSELSIDVLGGHTEITDAVTRTVLSITAIGKVAKKEMIDPNSARIGDSIVMTKKAGIEGTAILAHDRYKDLKKRISPELLDEAKGFLSDISVVPESKIASKLGVNGMHDVTEGGLIGASWELAEAMGKGIEIHADDIPIAFVTQEICNFYDLDPLKLISSGTMLIVTSDAGSLVRALGDAGIEASIIGEVMEGEEKYIIRDGKRQPLELPEGDHLMKAYKKEGRP